MYSGTLCAPAMLDGIEEAGNGRQRPFFFWHLCDGPSDAHCRHSGRHLFTVRNLGSGDLQAAASAVSTSVGSGPFVCTGAAAAAASEPRHGGAGGTVIQGLAARNRAAWSQTTERRTKHPHAALHKRLVRREERLL